MSRSPKVHSLTNLAEVRRFEDCGHYILEDAGDEIIPLVRNWVDDSKSRPTDRSA
jgi:hypothetical protein